MKEKLLGLWAKVVANKDVVIKAGSAVAGAALGLAVAAFIANSYDETETGNEMLDLDEDDEV